MCATCNAIYSRVDKKRIVFKNYKNKFIWDNGENIVKEINRYRMEVGSPIIEPIIEKEIFSDEFTQKLVNFDTNELFEEDKVLEIHPDLLEKSELFELNKKQHKMARKDKIRLKNHSDINTSLRHKKIIQKDHLKKKRSHSLNFSRSKQKSSL